MGVFTHTSTLLLPNPSLSAPPVNRCSSSPAVIMLKAFLNCPTLFPLHPLLHLQYELTFILFASWYKLISACFVSVRTIVFNNIEYCIKALLFPLLSFALLSPYCSLPPYTLHLAHLPPLPPNRELQRSYFLPKSACTTIRAIDVSLRTK